MTTPRLDVSHSIASPRLASALALVLTLSCGGPGHEGDSCLDTGDCGDNLQCRNNVCALADFGLEVVIAHCVVLECELDADCGGSRTCLDGICHCGDDTDCGAGYCGAAECVGCRNGDDCGAGQVCNDGACEEECDSDAQCPALHGCRSGRCIPVGCKTHRECVRITGDATAVCDGDSSPPRCRIPCTSAFDCSPGGAHNYNGQTCHEGYCEPIGCIDDAECRAEVGPTLFGAECRDGPAPAPSPGATCGAGEYRCGDATCIPDTWACDGFADCTGGEDELGC